MAADSPPGLPAFDRRLWRADVPARTLEGETGQLGARLVEITFGSLGACPQVVTGLRQCSGPGVQRRPQLLALALRIGPGLA